ncbi:ribulose-phosphate 3-epimerase [Anaeroplasma bactoclasticum]|jgi:ribulose-phosphate 3-epimerase|uniref:Ribulose-phosphate 3-epimerase n=1 Tax=Anaeroplasma bactoclasticum TaxID=2088 RepID=A0A397RNE1_9MOLU|nr:ribulose-phosphate 3-epimerase [Anaeroplasma bactoclasticum]RIA75643.1 ribulose-phosphate 3-epimerase [Anaeroplasma bactoclasticum]
MKVSLSILTADFANMESSLHDALEITDYVHMDIMDGEFVPNISIGPAFVKAIRKITDKPFDTHLMIMHPQNYIKQFVDAGSQYITFHVEADCDIKKTIDLIKSYGVKAGISIKPKTKVEDILEYLPLVDMVLVMSVEPGFGGQSFMMDSIDKVKALKELKEKNNYSYLINIDGGIKDSTAPLISPYVDLAVSGSYVCNAENPKERIDILHNL